MANPRTLAELAEAEAPSLFLINAVFTLKDTNIPTVAETWLKTQISDLFDYIEQPLGTAPSKIDDATKIIYYDYGHLNVLEFMRFFLDCKRGFYGQFFGVTGPMQLTIMLRKYIQEREVSIIHNEQRLAQERKSDPNYLLNEYADYLQLKRRAEQGDAEAQKEIQSYRDYKPER